MCISNSITPDNSTSSDSRLPSIRCAVVICFDEDVSFHQINRIIGLNATNTLQWSSARLNPFTGNRNPGFWEYEFCEAYSESSDYQLSQVCDFLLQHKSGLRAILSSYTSGELIVRVFVNIHQRNYYPELALKKELMSAVLDFGGYVDIVVDDDF